MLGVILFFDGALLALGNVRPFAIPLPKRCLLNLLFIGLVLVWPHIDHRTNEDILLFRSETENARDGMFYWWNIACVLQVAVCWCDSRNVWVFEFVWV